MGGNIILAFYSNSTLSHKRDFNQEMTTCIETASFTLIEENFCEKHAICYKKFLSDFIATVSLQLCLQCIKVKKSPTLLHDPDCKIS